MVEFIAFIVILPVIWYLFFPDSFRRNATQLKSGSKENDSFSSSTISDYISKPFMTEPEQICFNLLNKIKREEDMIFCQISMGALLDLNLDSMKKIKAISQGEIKKARGAFSSKIVDFAIYSVATNRIIVVIELDDNSHLLKKDDDLQRDLMLKCAGYITVRIPFHSSAELTTNYIKNQLIKGGYRGTKE